MWQSHQQKNHYENPVYKSVRNIFFNFFSLSNNSNLHYKTKETFVLPTKTSYCYMTIDLIQSPYSNDVLCRLKRYAQKLQRQQ